MGQGLDLGSHAIFYASNHQSVPCTIGQSRLDQRRSSVQHTFVTVEVSEVLEQLVSVAHQDLNYRPGFVWVGYKHLRQHMSLFARWSGYVCLLVRVTHAGQHAKRLPSLG